MTINVTKSGSNDSCPIQSVTGSQARLEVGDIMVKEFICVPPDRSINATAKIMAENNASCVLVTDNGSPVGIVTKTNLLKKMASDRSNFHSETVDAIMSSPVESVPHDLSILQAGKLLDTKKIRQLTVLRDGVLVGIVTQDDLVKAFTTYGMWRGVGEIVTNDPIQMQKNATVVEALKNMAVTNLPCVVAVEENIAVGVLTETDILKRVIATGEDINSLKIEDVMSSPIISVSSDYSVFSASRLMEKNKIHTLVITEDRHFSGIVTQSGILKAVKNKLQQHEEKNFKFLENSKNSIYILDANSKITYVNPAFIELMELSEAGELIGQSFLPEKFWVNPKDRIEFLSELENGHFKTRELSLKTSGGKKLHVTCFVTFTRNVHNKINRIQGTLYDITPTKELASLKETQKALQQSKERYQRISQTVTDYIFTVILEDGHAVKTIHRDSSFLVTGYTARDFAEDTDLWIKMVHPEDRNTVLDQIQQCLSGQNVEPIEHKIVHKTGRIRWVRSTLVQNFDTEGRLLSYDGLLKDITKRKDAEIELLRYKDKLEELVKQRTGQLQTANIELNQEIAERKKAESQLLNYHNKLEELVTERTIQLEATNEKLENVNEQLEASVKKTKLMAEKAVMADHSKGDFLAHMSHEIRTPLNTIIGFGELLAEDSLTENQKYHANIIQESSRTLLRLISDILDFSKIEAGKIDVEVIDCSLGKLLSMIRSLLRTEVTEKGLELKILESGKLPAMIRTDPVRIHQCLVNLITNAIKFTEKGGVYITVSVQQHEHEPYICFEVRDTGIGIKPEKQEAIFDPFIQENKSITRTFGGTGLGLAITKKLVNLLGGKLSLKSIVGEGSTFTLMIPAGVDVNSQPALGTYLSDDEQKPQVSSLEEYNFNGNILVAEDSKTNCMLIKVLLEKMGIGVTIVYNGRDAVRCALKEKFDLILMDIHMPKMDGYEATKKLRQKGIKTPIAALTAGAMKGDDQKCFDAGCDDYISKPIERRKLLEVIQKYLSADMDQGDSNDGNINPIEAEMNNSSSTNNAEQAQIPINWNSLIDLCGDEQTAINVVKIFLSEAKVCRQHIIDAMENKKFEDVQLYAHQMKGASSNITAARLVEKTYKLECAGRDKDIDAVGPLFEELRAELDNVLMFLSADDWVNVSKKHAQQLQTR